MFRDYLLLKIVGYHSALIDCPYINIMSKSFVIYRELISYALTFAEGAETFPSKEKIYRKALKKALITLYETNLE